MCKNVPLPASNDFKAPGQSARRTLVDGGQRNAKTYRMANLRGLTMKSGVNISAMQVANSAKAASISPPKTSMRSHRLTVILYVSRVRRMSAVYGYASLLHPRRFTQELPSVTVARSIAAPSGQVICYRSRKTEKEPAGEKAMCCTWVFP